ncbi:MAG: flavodoxin family protein [Candidatus Thorarchaeota archaeon]
MVKVVAINGSPRMDKGNTTLILTPFLEGIREAGADVELFYTKKLNIRPCQGNWKCVHETPGECFQKDDMQMLHPKLMEADIWIFATPVYISGMTGPLKNLIDRILIPMGSAQTEIVDGQSRYRKSEDMKRGKIVLVSNSGYWERDNFDLLIEQMKAVADHAEWEYSGSLIRPHGEVMKPMLKQQIPIDDIFDAAREAGQQLIKNGQILPETLDIVSRVLVPREHYAGK